jgi:hypothetical protein
VRYFLALLICCLTARGVLAQTGGADRADITGYGIVSGPDGVKDGVSSSGIEHRRSKGNHIVETTTRVPACLGIKFGIEFSVAGAPARTPAIREVYKFPSPGLHMPGASSPIRETYYDLKLIPGPNNIEAGYAFDKAWELVPGAWIIEIYAGSRLLASKTFTVVTPKKAECPALSV